VNSQRDSWLKQRSIPADKGRESRLERLGHGAPDAGAGYSRMETGTISETFIAWNE
jgi:hypothetical protein